jgi:hypothetical protein
MPHANYFCYMYETSPYNTRTGQSMMNVSHSQSMVLYVMVTIADIETSNSNFY